MPLPKWLGQFSSMIVTSRPLEEGEEPFLERDFQHEAIVQEEFSGDKGRAVNRNAERIRKTKDFIKQARKDSKAQELLAKQLEDLEQEKFQLLRNEILNWAKETGAGLIKNKWVLKMLEKEKLKSDKNKPKH